MITEISFPEIVGPNGIFSDGDWVESKDQNPDGGTRLLQRRTDALSLAKGWLPLLLRSRGQTLGEDHCGGGGSP